MPKRLLDDIPIYNKARDKAWEAFIKRKDVKRSGMFSKGFPLEREYYELWCQAWSRAWDDGFKDGRNDTSQERVDERTKLRHEKEPWSRVSIGVDMTEKGAHVIGIYGMTDDTSQIFYAKFYPAPQRTWVDLTDEEIEMVYAVTIKVRKKDIMPEEQKMFAQTIQHFLKEKNT